MLCGKVEALEALSPQVPSCSTFKLPRDSLTSRDFFQNIQDLDAVQCGPLVKMLTWSGENKNCAQSGKVGRGDTHLQPQHSETEADKSVSSKPA